ncbi:MAG: iron-binding protein [Campylobacterales bacterium]|nr:iron-binding protein [Campylobacterales bacterium]
MTLEKLYQAKHELWLKFLYGSFAVDQVEIKEKLYEFSRIEFRHLKWLANTLKEKNIEYNYDKNQIDIQKKTNFEYFEFLIHSIKSCVKHYNPNEVLSSRMVSDEFYFIRELEQLLQNQSNNSNITAFDRKKNYKDLDEESKNALTIFLFEESYKEYELILLYSYFQNYTDDILLYNIYQDMIDESHYHLKSFGQMMAYMGILAIPRLVFEPLYKNKDVKKFLIDGIAEEEEAKAQCAKLASSIKDEDISKFLTFVMFQENYHIALMEKAIARFK